MHSSLAFTSHRPWPLPATKWLWRQRWRQLGFIHYRVDAAVLRALLPSWLQVQEFEGSAWVGVAPFLMMDVMRGNLLGVPPLRRFPELNVRTYVEHEGKAGVWFFSLDADCWPIVLAGRGLYGLPYFKARMTHRFIDTAATVESVRLKGGTRFSAVYQPAGEVFTAAEGTFAHWATERYCLYSEVRGAPLRLEVHHQPWPLQRAEVEVTRSELFNGLAFAPMDPKPVCHFSTGVDVISYAPRRLLPSRVG